MLYNGYITVIWLLYNSCITFIELLYNSHMAATWLLYNDNITVVELLYNSHITVIYLWRNISNSSCSVSSPDETPRRELKIRRAADYFWRTSRCFIWGWNTVSNVWYFFSNKSIFEGEIKDAKMSSFSFDIQTLIKH